jgi:ribonucleoside-triphosphate reductase
MTQKEETMPSMRADLIARRTYQREKEDGSLESWSEVVTRCIKHQRWLWERAIGRKLNVQQNEELRTLESLMIPRKASLAGRTLWMGGTDKIMEREVANFNCSFTRVESVHDVVDIFWLLLNGSGTGFSPVDGLLSGFMQPIPQIEIIRSKRKQNEKGRKNNIESWNPKTGVWMIGVGDSGEAWAKSVGKLVAGKYPASKLVIDFSEVRGGGSRLNGYGWISSGDNVVSAEFPKIISVLNKRAGRLLSKADIHDIVNHLGVMQTGRRGAQIALMDYGDPEWRNFATFKKNHWKNGSAHRAQSNNSLMFWEQPQEAELKEIFDLMLDSGGSEPGFINAEEARRRAPWFAGLNPCGEILLANKGFCNLTTVNMAVFRNMQEMQHAIYLIARANYRQTLVELDDGILQRSWHETNQFLRLCGVNLTGWQMRPDLGPYEYKAFKNMAIEGAFSMARELNMQLPKNVTTVQPSGTLSKIMDAKEGCHEAVGRYIFNNVLFNRHDPLISKLKDAGYKTFEADSDSTAVTLPVEWPAGNFTRLDDGRYVNTETAVDQLNRYRSIMKSWCEQNCSITIRYDEKEVPAIREWLSRNWDSYVGVSFILREDPTKTAKDLGYPYLPQEPVNEKTYRDYVKGLRSINLEEDVGGNQELLDDDCESGICPVR